MDDLLNLEKLTAVEQKLLNVKALMEAILKLNKQMQELQTMKFYFGIKKDEPVVFSSTELIQPVITTTVQEEEQKPEPVEGYRGRFGRRGHGKVTDEQKQFIKTAYLEGEKSVKEIADSVGLTTTGVKYHIEKMGLASLPASHAGGRRKEDVS